MGSLLVVMLVPLLRLRLMLALLEGFDLAALQTVKVLLLHVNAANGLTKGCRLNVLNLLGCQFLGYLEGLFHEVVGGEARPAQLQVHRGPHKLQFDARLPRSGLFKGNLVDAKVELPRLLIISGDHDDGLEAGEVHLIDDAATEKVKKDILDLFVIRILFPEVSAEYKARL